MSWDVHEWDNLATILVELIPSLQNGASRRPDLQHQHYPQPINHLVLPQSPSYVGLSFLSIYL